MNYVLYVYAFGSLLYTLSCVKEKIKIIYMFILDNDDEIIMHVFASKGYPCCVFELESSITSLW
jgi:hypothetical protein